MYYYRDFSKHTDEIDSAINAIKRNSRQELLEYWHFLKDAHPRKCAQLYLHLNDLRAICQINCDQNTQHYVDAQNIILIGQYDGFYGSLEDLLFRDFVQNGLANMLQDKYSVIQPYL